MLLRDSARPDEVKEKKATVCLENYWESQTVTKQAKKDHLSAHTIIDILYIHTTIHMLYIHTTKHAYHHTHILPNIHTAIYIHHHAYIPPFICHT